MPIKYIQKEVQKVKLLAVNTDVVFGKSRCTQLILENRQPSYCVTKNFDKKGEVTARAKSLVGKYVDIMTNVPEDEPNKWGPSYFSNVKESV